MLTAAICFALIAALVKQVRHLPLAELILFRNIPLMIIVPVMIKKMNISFLGNNKPMLILSGAVITIGTIASFYAFTSMYLTDAMTIQQLNPFFTFFLAGIFLKEKLHFRQMPLFLLAFLGGLLVIKPGFRIDIVPAMIALLSAIFISFSHTTLRYLRLTDHYLVITNYRTYIITLVNLIILITQKNFEIPSLSDLLILALIGIFALIAQITLTKAYQLTPASLVSLYNYSQIIFATFFALLFFKEIPDMFTIMGAIFIIISGYLNYRQKSNNLN